MIWKANKWGIYATIGDNVIVKLVSHFAPEERLISVVQIFGNDSLAINIHTAINYNGDIFRTDLCVSYNDKLEQPHPTIRL